MAPSYDCIGLMLFNVGASFDRPRRPDTVALREGICSYAGCYLLVLYVWLQSLSLFLISFSRNYRLERELKNRLWKIDYSQLGFDRRASNTSLASAIVNVSTTVELLCSEVPKKKNNSCLILWSSIRYFLDRFYYLILHFEKFLNLQLTFAVCSNVTLHLSNIFKLQRLVTLKLLVLYCLIYLTWWILQLSLFMQKDTHDHDENVPLMREESSDGKVTTAGYYKVRCCLPSSHSSTMCLNLRVTFRPWVLIRSGNRLF